MGIHQTGRDVPAWKPLGAGDRLSDQAPGRIHPQLNRPVTIWQLHRAHCPRHSGIICLAEVCVSGPEGQRPGRSRTTVVPRSLAVPLAPDLQPVSDHPSQAAARVPAAGELAGADLRRAGGRAR